MTDQPDKQKEQPEANANKTGQPDPAPPAKAAEPSSPAPEKPTASDDPTKPSASKALAELPAAPAPVEPAKPESPPAPAAKPETPAQPAASAPAPAAAAPVSPAPVADVEKTAVPGKSPLTEPPAVKDAAADAKEQTIPPFTTAPVPGGPPKPAAAPAPSAGTVCPTCGHRNRPGVLLCENCGTNLMTGRQSGIGTRDLKREQEAVADGEKLLDTGQSKAIDSAGSASFSESMVLRIEIEGGTTPMMVYPKSEIILGRRDPNTGAMPDVDLTAYAGYRMGVSRSHAAIRFQDKQLNLSDLGSSNGTFLNGTRLTAHRPYQLRDGDEIRLGQMVLRVYFQSNRQPK